MASNTPLRRAPLSVPRPSLRVRLLALVLVPTTLFGIVAGRSAQDQWQAASRARLVQQDVADLAGLVDLKSALLLARVPVEVDVRSSSIGLDSAAARELLGLQPSQVSDLAGVTAALRALPPQHRPFEQAEVEALTEMTAQGSSDAVLERFDDLDAQTDLVWEERLLDLRDEIVGLGDQGLAAQLTDLEHAAIVGGTATSLITGLAEHWFPGETSAAAKEEAQVAMAVNDARLDRSLTALVGSSNDAIAAAALDVSETRSGVFGQAVDAVLAEPSTRPPAIDVAQAAATFRSSFDLFAPILDIIDSLSADLERSAERSANASTAAARRTIAAAVLVPMLVLAASLLLAASFERPLQRMIDALRRLGEGRLDTPPVPTTGPPELAAAAAALNEVGQNLQLVEQKMRSLASHDRTDPLADRPLPGELGRALASSFAVLDESIRDRASLHDELAHQATHDQLTGIANRAGILAALELAIGRQRGPDTALLVAFLDLDGFKGVNDTHGHRQGDRVLCEVAARLATHARADDVAGRLGGDEFVLVAENIPAEQVALQLARRVADAVRRPIAIDGGQISVGVSIGLVLTTEPGESAVQLLDRADRAVYEAKSSPSSISVAAT